jgi:hypothetical protein
MDFATAMHMLQLKDNEVFPIEGLQSRKYLLLFTKHCMKLIHFQVYIHENILEMVQAVHDQTLVELPVTLMYHVCKCGEH